MTTRREFEENILKIDGITNIETDNKYPRFLEAIITVDKKIDEEELVTAIWWSMPIGSRTIGAEKVKITDSTGDGVYVRWTYEHKKEEFTDEQRKAQHIEMDKEIREMVGHYFRGWEKMIGCDCKE